jgi:hypothetical protein
MQQPFDSSGIPEKPLITSEVTAYFFETPCQPNDYTLYPMSMSDLGFNGSFFVWRFK